MDQRLFERLAVRFHGGLHEATVRGELVQALVQHLVLGGQHLAPQRGLGGLRHQGQALLQQLLANPARGG